MVSEGTLKMVESPSVVCSLNAATRETRRARLLPGLVGRATARHDAGEVVHLQFSADMLPAIAAVIEAERQCCRFLRFDVSVEPDEGPIHLTLSGPPGTRAFLESLCAP